MRGRSPARLCEPRALYGVWQSREALHKDGGRRSPEYHGVNPWNGGEQRVYFRHLTVGFCRV
jgi:hypothetical protein